jgi:hypothetical protein
MLGQRSIRACWEFSCPQLAATDGACVASCCPLLSSTTCANAISTPSPPPLTAVAALLIFSCFRSQIHRDCAHKLNSSQGVQGNKMVALGYDASGLRSAFTVLLICLWATQAHAWGVVLFRGSKNCSSDTVSFARLCAANKCCDAIAYDPATQTESAIGAMGHCANGRVLGKLYSAYGNAVHLHPPAGNLCDFALPSPPLADCSGQVISTFDVEELTSDEITSARCSIVGIRDSAMGDCSGSSMLRFTWQAAACLLLVFFFP